MNNMAEILQRHFEMHFFMQIISKKLSFVQVMAQHWIGSKSLSKLISIG